MTEEAKKACNEKLKNQFFGLLCEYEKNGEWEKFLDAIIIELLGYEEDRKTIDYYKLMHKANSLRYLSYRYFRVTIFDCMNLCARV